MYGNTVTTRGDIKQTHYINNNKTNNAKSAFK